MDGWETTFLLGWPIFRCYVSFREGKLRGGGVIHLTIYHVPASAGSFPFPYSIEHGRKVFFNRDGWIRLDFLWDFQVVIYAIVPWILYSIGFLFQTFLKKFEENG